MKELKVYDKQGEEITERYIIDAQLGQLFSVIEYFIEQDMECKQIKKSLHHLRKFIRNRDLHSYEKDVRGSDLYLVKSKFLPSFNYMLALLDQTELKYHLAGIK